MEGAVVGRRGGLLRKMLPARLNRVAELLVLLLVLRWWLLQRLLLWSVWGRRIVLLLLVRVLDLLRQAGIAAQGDAERPFDHGAWVVLMHLFPQADLPVVQVALPAGAGPAEVHAMGAALRGLRAQGVLVVGSGSMTHNLREFFGGGREPAPYVVEFGRWIEAAVERGDLPALLDYRRRAPHAQRAHPTEDHFLPLFFALGAAGEGWGAEYLSREVMYGMLAMDAFALHAPAAA
ncbi:MAG: class III extradiol ring-cleavage dioxygenase [Acidovorax sp.]|nr:class III extradiol ring-cleavage dioxygenase [Acidovorax sp.]